MMKVLSEQDGCLSAIAGGNDARAQAERGGPVDVSVVIPSFNRAGMVERAVDSVLSQPWGMAVEAVVVDDGSTDDTLDRLRAYDDRLTVVVFGKNRGRNEARNAGRRASSGEWLKFLDSDDVLEPGALEKEVAAGRDAAADLVVTSWRVGDPEGRDARTFPVPRFERGVDSLLEGKAVPTSAALYRRSFIADLDWDTNLYKLDDWDFFVRAYLGTPRVVSLPLVSYTWVVHVGQGTRWTKPLVNALEHHVILRKIEAHLWDAGQLTQPRKKRLAQYFYKELRVLSLSDRGAFDRAVAHILELDPKFQPRDEPHERWMKGLSRIIGFRSALLLHSAVKKAFRGNPLSASIVGPA